MATVTHGTFTNVPLELALQMWSAELDIITDQIRRQKRPLTGDEAMAVRKLRHALEWLRGELDVIDDNAPAGPQEARYGAESLTPAQLAERFAYARHGCPTCGEGFDDYGMLAPHVQLRDHQIRDHSSIGLVGTACHGACLGLIQAAASLPGSGDNHRAELSPE